MLQHKIEKMGQGIGILPEPAVISIYGPAVAAMDVADGRNRIPVSYGWFLKVLGNVPGRRPKFYVLVFIQIVARDIYGGADGYDRWQPLQEGPQDPR